MYYTNNVPQQPYYGCQFLYAYNDQNSYLKYNYQNPENAYYNIPSYDVSNQHNISIPVVVKPRSKTWDKIKSMTNASKKCKYHHPVSQNYINIPRYREESIGSNYVSPYFCPPNQYHIHSKHNQVNILEKLYLHDNQPSYHKTVCNYKKSHSKTPHKQQPRHHEVAKDTSSSDLFQPQLIKPRQSRSRSAKQLKKIIQSSFGNTSSDSFHRKSKGKTSNKSENIYQDISGSNEKENTTQSLIQPVAPPPPPPPPINDEIFKPTKCLLFKKKPGSLLPEQTEQSFNAVVNELKSRLTAIKLTKELAYSRYEQEAKEENSEKPLAFLNKVNQTEQQNKVLKNTDNENLLKILHAGKSNLKHVTQSTTFITEKKSTPVVTKSTNAIFTTSTPFDFNEPTELNEKLSREVTRDWFNSTNNSDQVQSKPEIKNASSFLSSSSSSTSSSSSIVSTSTSEKTNSIRQSSKNPDSQYKLEIYNEIDDMSDDYTNITRLMLSPKPPSTILPATRTSNSVSTSGSQKQSNNSLFAEQQNKKKITAFCTNNLFRDSKKLKSNYIRIAESFNSSPGFESCQNAEENYHNRSLINPIQNSNTSSSLSQSLKEYPASFMSFVQNKDEQTAPVKPYESNFKNIIPTQRASIPSKFSSFNVYNQISMQISQTQENGSCAEDKEQPCFELSKGHNKKIDEYLNEMSSYYRNLQTNIQYRG